MLHKRSWIVVFALVLSSAVLHAQTAGTISGIVQDQSAAAIPGATVTIKNVDTGILRTTVSDEAGRKSKVDVGEPPIGPTRSELIRNKKRRVYFKGSIRIFRTIPGIIHRPSLSQERL